MTLIMDHNFARITYICNKVLNLLVSYRFACVLGFIYLVCKRFRLKKAILIWSHFWQRLRQEIFDSSLKLSYNKKSKSLICNTMRLMLCCHKIVYLLPLSYEVIWFESHFLFSDKLIKLLWIVWGCSREQNIILEFLRQ